MAVSEPKVEKPLMAWGLWNVERNKPFGDCREYPT